MPLEGLDWTDGDEEISMHGYHIVRLLADPAEEKTDAKEVDANIRYRIRQEEKGKEMERLLKSVAIKDLK